MILDVTVDVTAKEKRRKIKKTDHEGRYDEAVWDCITLRRRPYALKRDEIQPKMADDIHRTLCGDDMPSLRLG